MNKLNVLINYVSSEVYQLFYEATTYDEAINLLKSLCVKTPNEVFARHKLATRKQKPGKSLDEYLQELKRVKTVIFLMLQRISIEMKQCKMRLLLDYYL